jgi:hypothetical protein
MRPWKPVIWSQSILENNTEDINQCADEKVINNKESV